MKISYGRQSINDKDIQEVVNVLQSDFLTQGPVIEQFEKKIASYCKVKYAVSFSSGTAALHGTCFAAGIGSGDEVITTPMTFAASSNCVLYQKGTPVFADIISSTLPLIDPKEIKNILTKKTKAIIPVDYSGIPCDYEEINAIAKENKLIVIADATHSLGATYKEKKVGTFADMSVFSFHPVKLITTGEGGMVVTNNKFFYERLKLFRTHGITKEKKLLQNKTEGSWYQEMQCLGYNYRFTDIQAALGISQMRRIEEFLKKRRKIAKKYQKAFQNLKFIELIKFSSKKNSAWHLFPVQLKTEELKQKKKEIFKAFHKVGILVQVHYVPIHLHPYYQKRFGYKRGDFPNAESFYDGEISLPLYPGLSKKEQGYVIKTLQRVISAISN